MSAAASRLRKAFRYPSDADLDDASLDGDLDEEHQEQLITSLRESDAAKNDLYRKLFLLIPVIGAVFFLLSFLLASTARQRLFALLSFSSLTCTGYILQFMPIRAEGKGKKPMYKVEAEKSPLERYLLPANLALVAVLQLAAIVSGWKGAREDAYRESLPMVIFGLSMFARQQLAPLDLEELQRARFELKGA